MEVPNKETIDRLKAKYEGKRVILQYTSDPYTKLKPGDEGECFMVDAMGQLQIKWDNGSTLAMIPGEDRVGWIESR